MAVSGDTAFVGAHGGSTARDNVEGAVYVFRRDEGGMDNWGEVAKLTASDGSGFYLFGSSVAASGDTIVVGSYQHWADAYGAGAAYVFRRDQGGADRWDEVAKLTASDVERQDEFGYSVAISGDTAVVGAWREDAGGAEAGAAYVFGLAISAGNDLRGFIIFVPGIKVLLGSWDDPCDRVDGSDPTFEAILGLTVVQDRYSRECFSYQGFGLGYDADHTRQHLEVSAVTCTMQ